MAKVSYYLDKPNEQKSLIALRIASQGKRITISTGENIETKFWNKNTQRAKQTTAFPEGTPLNQLLNNLESEINQIIKTAKANQQPITKEFLKEKADTFLNKGGIIQSKISNSFFRVYDEFVTVAGTQRSERTIKKYQTLKQQLQDFQQQKRVKVDFDNIDIKFFDKLTAYYYNDLQFVNNTFGKYVSTLKTFLNWATDRGYNTKIDYRKFKVIKEDADIVVLTADELQRLYALDLSQNRRLAKIRDTFCLGCYTGLRFSDLEQLRPEHVRGSMLLIKTYKTRDTIQVPLRPKAQQIVAKYADEPDFIPTITNQKTNEYLKELCQLAEINESTTISRYKGAQRVEFSKPKHEFITTHCARRTFVTLSLEAGVRPELVMAVTGHKSYKTFKKYIKITDKVVENEFQRVWQRDTASVAPMRVAN